MFDDVLTVRLRASSSVTPDGSRCVVSNVTTGFDVYDMETAACTGGCKNEAGQLRAVPVLFVHEGHAILGGSTLAQVNLWHTRSRSIFQTLELDGVYHGHLHYIRADLYGRRRSSPRYSRT